jgi:hypothetical protein
VAARAGELGDRDRSLRWPPSAADRRRTKASSEDQPGPWKGNARLCQETCRRRIRGQEDLVTRRDPEPSEYVESRTLACEQGPGCLLLGDHRGERSPIDSPPGPGLSAAHPGSRCIRPRHPRRSLRHVVA